MTYLPQPNVYTDGDVVSVTATFVDAEGAPIDPSVVELSYAITPPGQAVQQPKVTLTFAGASVPAAGQVARTAKGMYVTWLDTTAKPGAWKCEGRSTGAGQTASRVTEFQVVVGL